MRLMKVSFCKRRFSERRRRDYLYLFNIFFEEPTLNFWLKWKELVQSVQSKLSKHFCLRTEKWFLLQTDKPDVMSLVKVNFISV